MPRKVALGRRQALGGQLSSDRAHADLRIDQNMRRIGEDHLAPAVSRKRTLDETFAKGLRLECRCVAALPGVIAEETEPVAVELPQPAPNVELPHRMVAEVFADDPHPDGLPRSRRERQGRGRVPFTHDLANRRTVERLEIAVVVSLVGKEKRLVRANPLGQTGGRLRSPEVLAQLSQVNSK